MRAVDRDAPIDATRANRRANADGRAGVSASAIILSRWVVR